MFLPLLFRQTLPRVPLFPLGADHHIDHHDDGDDVGDGVGQVGADVVLQAQADGVEKAEHQRRQIRHGGIGLAEDDAGEGDIAP